MRADCWHGKGDVRVDTIPGHENMGEVVEFGSEVTNLAISGTSQRDQGRDATGAIILIL